MFLHISCTYKEDSAILLPEHTMKASSTRRSRSTGRTTLSDVAQMAGVSPITVSRALRGERSVNADLVDRVQAAAAKLGYVPDPAARALASSRGTHVAVLVPMLTNQLFVDLLETAQHTLVRAGYQTLIGVTHYDPREEEQLLRDQLLHRPAGLLVTGFDRSDETRELMVASRVPVVHLMETSTEAGVYSVGFSQQAAGHAMTRHLLERGRRRIVFAAAQLDPRTFQRLEGYRACMREAGLYDASLECMRNEPTSLSLGARMFEEMLQSTPTPDAVFFCNDDLAQGGLLAALRLGVKVPTQMAVAGFNDLTASDQMLPRLTTVRTPRPQIGERAAQMLIQLMRGEPVASPCVDLGYELMVRDST